MKAHVALLATLLLLGHIAVPTNSQKFTPDGEEEELEEVYKEEYTPFVEELMKDPRRLEYDECMGKIAEVYHIRAETQFEMDKRQKAMKKMKDGGVDEVPKLQLYFVERMKLMQETLVAAGDAYSSDPDGSSLWDLCAANVANEKAAVLLLYQNPEGNMVVPKMDNYEAMLKVAARVANKTFNYVYEHKEEITGGRSEKTKEDWNEHGGYDFLSRIKDQLKQVRTNVARAYGKYLVSSSAEQDGSIPLPVLRRAYGWYKFKWFAEPQSAVSPEEKGNILFEEGGIALNIAQAIMAEEKKKKKNSEAPPDQAVLDEVDSWYRRAVEAFEECMYYGESAAFQEKKWNCAHHLATTCATIGENTKAKQAFEMAVKLDSHKAAIHIDFGTFLQSNGDSEGALKAFAFAAKLDPTNKELAKKYMALKQTMGSSYKADKSAYRKEREKILREREKGAKKGKEKDPFVMQSQSAVDFSNQKAKADAEQANAEL